MQDLTVSVYTFENLLTGNYLYVDKTAYLWHLVKPTNGIYFLSRPRRFGKSLTLSTLKAIFQGKRELFQGLAIDQMDYDWKPYPIIHLDLGDCGFDTPAILEKSLQNTLSQCASICGLALRGDNAHTQFSNLIFDLRKIKNEKVVILIDEYDKPILGNATNPQVGEILKVLKGFYSVIKKCEPQERFVFITGVSKFSHVSIFSDLNNLEDLTMRDQFALMLGYTQEELEHNFAERITAVATAQNVEKENLLSKLKLWYNGYQFSDKAVKVYNPVSTANFFLDDGKFKNYWFSTGTPNFLLELLKNGNYNFSDILQEPVEETFFNSFEISQLDPKILLYQTGYLTIKEVKKQPIPYTDMSVTNYYLRFPNYEVEASFNSHLLAYYTDVKKHASQKLIVDLISAIGSGEVDKFMKILQGVFANIPYNIHVKNEHYYQTIFYVICEMLRFYIAAEICTNDGRIDLVLGAGEWLYVIEIKLNKSANAALKQIENKEYALKYQNSGKRIMLVGVNFDFDKGQITDYLAESP